MHTAITTKPCNSAATSPTENVNSDSNINATVSLDSLTNTSQQQRLPLLRNQFGQASATYSSNRHREGNVKGSDKRKQMEIENQRMPTGSQDGMITTVEDELAPPSKQQKLIKIGLLVALVAIIVYVVIDYTVPGLGFVADTLTSFLEWVEENPGLGAIAFACVYIFTTVCFIPGSLLTLGAGLVFGRALGTGLGVLVGSVAVLVGATIGAILAFLLGRFVLRDQAQGLFNKFKILKAVDRAIESQGLKLVILLRLSPVVPFSAFNYVMGVTAVQFRDYALGCLGFIPGTVAYVFIGTTASSLLGDDDAAEDDDGSSARVQLIVIIVGAIATIIAVVLISIYAKRALNKVLEEGAEEDRRQVEVEAGLGMGNGGNALEEQGTNRPVEEEYPMRAGI